VHQQMDEKDKEEEKMEERNPRKVGRKKTK
jgi:hypothetical protein